MPTRSPSPIPLARSVALAPFVQFLEQGGASTHSHLRAARIDPEIFLSPESLLPLQQATWFIERSGQQVGQEDFGLQVGVATPIASLGLFGTVLAQSLTVRDLVQRLVRWAPALNSGVRVALFDRGGSTVEIRTWYMLDQTPRHVDDFSLLLILDALRLGLGSDWCPQVVEMRPRSIPFAGRHEILSEARCLPSRTHTAVHLPRTALDLPLRGRLRGRPTHSELDLELTSPTSDFGESVAKVVESMLGIEPPTIETAAEIAATSVRTFQRRLAIGATTFEAIVDRVRFEKGLSLLADPNLKLGDLAERLGYSDAANFTRAFRRWTGSSPGAYRKRQHRSREGTSEVVEAREIETPPKR